MVEIANSAVVARASVKDATGKRAGAARFRPKDARWRRSRRSARTNGAHWPNAPIDPNGYYLPDWELAVNASARGRTDVAALSAWGDASSAQDGAARLIGLLPVISMWRAYRIPLPALASADPYGTLGTPPLDRDTADEAAARLMRQARRPAPVP